MVLALQDRQVIIGVGLSGLTERRPTFFQYFSVISFHIRFEYNIFGRSFTFSVNCSYFEWSAWDSCTVTCGEGTKMRTRAIKNFPLNGGEPCSDPVAEISHCVEICGMYFWTKYDYVVIEAQY